MRRRTLPPVGIPERLCRYVPHEWPGGVREWTAGALRFVADNPSTPLPFGEFGDGIDVLREAARLIRGGSDGR